MRRGGRAHGLLFASRASLHQVYMALDQYRAAELPGLSPC